jgi:hypothetical protein
MEPVAGDGDFLDWGLLATCLGLDCFCFFRRAFSLRSLSIFFSAALLDGVFFATSCSHRQSLFRLPVKPLQTISDHRAKGLTFDAISEWLDKEGYLTVRGKQFRSAHVHSILKKRLAKEELLKRKYPPVWSNFSMEVVDKTILMCDFNFLKKEK